MPRRGDKPNVFISEDSTFGIDLTLKYDSDTSTKIFSAITFDVGDVFGPTFQGLNSKAVSGFKTTLRQNLLTFDSSTAKSLSWRNGNNNTPGQNYTTNVFSQAAKEDLGTKKFLVLGAYSGVQVNGDISNDYIVGTNHADMLSGYEFSGDYGTSYDPDSSGVDEIRGFGGDDWLYGGGGGEGDDKLFGGEGIDTASYQHNQTKGITVDLALKTRDHNNLGNDPANRFQDNTTNYTPQEIAALKHWYSNYAVVTDDGSGQKDRLYSIENIVGSDFADTIKGDDQNNSLAGRNGNDSLDGRAGNDTLDGGAGNDILTGNGGADRFNYESVTHLEGVDTNTDTTIYFTDTITDFTRSQGDKIYINKAGFGGITDTSGFTFANGTLSFNDGTNTKDLAILQGVSIFDTTTDIVLY